MNRYGTAIFLSVMVAFVSPVSAQFGRGVDVALDIFYASDGVHPGSTAKAAVQVALPKGYHVNSNKPLEEFLIPTVLSFNQPDGFRIAEIAYPEAIMLKTGGLDEPLAVFEETFLIGVAVAVPENVPPGKHALSGSLRYQACDDKACYAPKTVPVGLELNVVSPEQPITPQNEDIFKRIVFTGAPGDVAQPGETPQPVATAEEGDLLAMLDGFTILGTTGGYLNSGKFLAWVDSVESGEVQRGWFEGKGPLAIIALILVGGLALNLTPCVLPMIPINLAIIGAGARAGSRARGFALGGAYGLAMALVYGVLGLVVILTAGTFGAINASPWFNLGIAVLFVILALAMFDIIQIDFSRFQAKFNLGKLGKGTFLLAFGMGGVAALLAGACVAPVVIQVIVFSSDLYAKGQTLALALPFLLGVGMALPWPVAGAGLSLLPKPGPWMVRVKQAFGVFILGFAVYYGYIAYGIFANRMVDRQAVASSVEALIEKGWYPSMTQGLAAAKAENKKVLVDMWATWCKNCLTMDKTTFKDEAVLARLDGYVKIKFQAEDPESSPAKEVMQRFNAIGLPTYAILEPK